MVHLNAFIICQYILFDDPGVLAYDRRHQINIKVAQNAILEVFQR